MRGRTLTLLLKTSKSDGMDSSPVTMTRPRPDCDNIQSRCSAPISLVTTKSFMANGSRDPKMDERNLLQASRQEFTVTNRVFNQLPIVSIAQITAINVSQHVRPTKSSKNWRRATHISHNWPKHWQFVRRTFRETTGHDHGYPTKSFLLARPHESSHNQPTLPEFQTVQPLDSSPLNSAWESSGQHSSQNDGLKAKQQCKSGIRRSDSWTFTELTTTSSRLQANMALTHSAVRKNCAHSFSTSSQLPPTFKASTKHDSFASTDNCGLTKPDSSAIKSSAKGYSPSRTTNGNFCKFIQFVIA